MITYIAYSGFCLAALSVIALMLLYRKLNRRIKNTCDSVKDRLNDHIMENRELLVEKIAHQKNWSDLEFSKLNKAIGVNHQEIKYMRSMLDPNRYDRSAQNIAPDFGYQPVDRSVSPPPRGREYEKHNSAWERNQSNQGGSSKQKQDVEAEIISHFNKMEKGNKNPDWGNNKSLNVDYIHLVNAPELLQNPGADLHFDIDERGDYVRIRKDMPSTVYLIPRYKRRLDETRFNQMRILFELEGANRSEVNIIKSLTKIAYLEELTGGIFRLIQKGILVVENE